MMERPESFWDQKETLRYLGHKRGQEIPDNVEELLQQCRVELERAASPRQFSMVFPLAIQDGEIDLGFVKTKSRALERNLRDCGEVLVFGATLGSGVDVLLQRYGHLQMSKAVVLQAASAAMLESYCDWQNACWKEVYRERGYYLRPRFSPGYGDFPLSCQRQIFAALELEKRIGVTLTDSLLMAPSKSVTAVIGISTQKRECPLSGCEVCGKRDCAYRR